MSVVHGRLSAAANRETWYLQIGDGTVYGPVDISALAGWAAQSRIAPGNKISRDQVNWMPAEDHPDLKMEWVAELPNGRRFGPFHALALPELFKYGELPENARLVNRATGRTLALREMLGRGESVAATAAPAVSRGTPTDTPAAAPVAAGQTHAELVALREQLARAEAERSEVVARLARTEAEREGLAARVASLNEEREALLRRLSEETVPPDEGVREDLELRWRELEEQLRGELQEAGRVNTRLEARVAELEQGGESVADEHAAELAAARAEAEAAGDREREARSVLESVRAEHEDLRRRMDHQAAHHADEVDRLKRAIETAERRAADAAGGVESAELERASLEDRVREIDRERVALSDQLTELRSHYERLGAESRQQFEEVDALRGAQARLVAEHEQALRAVRAELAEAQAATEAERGRSAEAEAAVVEARALAQRTESAMRELQGRLDATVRAAGAADEARVREKQEWERDLQSLARKLEEAVAELKRTKTEFAALETDRTRKVREVQEQVTQLESENAALRARAGAVPETAKRAPAWRSFVAWLVGLPPRVRMAAGVCVVVLVAGWIAWSVIGSSARQPLPEPQPVPEPMLPVEPSPAPPIVDTADLSAPLQEAVSDELPVTTAAAPTVPALRVPDAWVRTNGAALSFTFRDGLFLSGTRMTPDSERWLGTVAGLVQPILESCTLTLEGHTDSKPVSRSASFVDNYALGMERAEFVAAWLEREHGFPRAQMHTTSAGESDPPFAGESAAEQRRNRTVVFVLRPRE